MFVIAAFLDDEEMGQGMGSSKKEGEQAAAQNAIEKLNNRSGA
jgi:dsRNA-specific ribonuclease